MMTVPQAARRVGRNPETVRRWIREGRLRARKIGTQHIIEEEDLRALEHEADTVPLPGSWRRTTTGEPMPDWVAILRQQRAGH